MRVPLSWLKEFTPVEVDARDREGVDALRTEFDSLGLVVGAIERIGEGLEAIVLARVLDIQPIPKADRIRHVFVDAGGDSPLEIVCGAWNFGVGDVVALAPVGAVLPGGMQIARRTMRGVTSNGMLCSARELGLAEDAEGLMVLGSTDSSSHLTPGLALMEYLGVGHDVVFDLEVEPNRPDCLSMVGVARDLAARRRLPLSIPQPSVEAAGGPIADIATLVVDEKQACPRFTARAMSGLGSVASPGIVARRLVLSGMRPINAIVDASNYVMLEFGQPSHPYDLDRLGGPGFRVRFAKRGERIVTLDGQERVVGEMLDPFGRVVDARDLLICDANDEPVGIAGVMGGASTEIDASTKNLVLEVADFDALTVGRTAARFNLRSEASVRFWRGVDRDGLIRAADRVCELIQKAYLDAGENVPVVATGILDSRPGAFERSRIRVRPERVNALLGTSLSKDDMRAHLEPIGFSVEEDGDAFSVTIPSFRPDATREVDVIEEVARQHGYERIALTQRRSLQVGRLSSMQVARRRARRLLAAFGANEAWTSSIIDPDHAAERDVPHIDLTHPIVPKERALRSDLLSGLLGALAYNAGQRNGSCRLFEIGHVFARGATRDDAPIEYEQLALLCGQDGDDAKTAVQAFEHLIEGLGLERVSVSLRQIDGDESSTAHAIAAGAHPTRSALLEESIGSQSGVFGVVGEVDPEIAKSFGLENRRLGWLVVHAEHLFSLPAHAPNVEVVSHFPSSDIDLAFVLAESVMAAQLLAVLRHSAGDLCESISLIDVYRGAGVPDGSRSLTFRLRFCAPDRTLTDAEVGAARATCIEVAEKTLGATLRA